MKTKRHRWPVVVLCLVLAAAGGSAAGKPKPKKPPNYGPVVRKTIRTDLKPCGEVEGFGSMWVTNFGSGTVQRIDPTTNRVTGSVEVGASPCGIVVGAGALWINGFGTDSVERVDPVTLTRTAHIPVGRAPFDVLFADGSVWTTNNGDLNVMRIDPETNRVISTIPLGEAVAGLGFAAGSVWVGTNAGDKVFRIDPASESVTTISTGKSAPAWLSTRDDEVWVGSVLGNAALRIDPSTDRVAEVVKVGSSPVDGIVDERGLVWIPNRGSNSVSIIDAASAIKVTAVRVGPSPFVLNDGFGDVWAASFGGTDIRRLRAPLIVEAALAEHAGSGQGGTVRLIATARSRTRIIATLSGATRQEIAHVHRGHCGALRGASIASWKISGGRGARTLKKPIKTLTKRGRYALDVHVSTRTARYVACANLG
jgi:YVTN family beta-propeller protein